jgi:hypothetical protein
VGTVDNMGTVDNLPTVRYSSEVLSYQQVESHVLAHSGQLRSLRLGREAFPVLLLSPGGRSAELGVDREWRVLNLKSF